MASDRMNRYFLPNLEINRKVITEDIQYYLGPESTVRPYTREGEDGFLITTLGACLTDEQIDDICRRSKEVWEKQAAARLKKDNDSNSEKPLKRPLNQPVLISRATDSRSRRRSNEREKMRSGEYDSLLDEDRRRDNRRR